MAKKKEPYERIEMRAARGEYELVEPLDLMILEILPDEGTLFAGLYPLGESVVNIRTKLGKKEIPSTVISSRMYTLAKQGLVVKQRTVRGNGGKAVWQRSLAGKALLTERKGNKDGS